MSENLSGAHFFSSVLQFCLKIFFKYQSKITCEDSEKILIPLGCIACPWLALNSGIWFVCSVILFPIRSEDSVTFELTFVTSKGTPVRLNGVSPAASGLSTSAAKGVRGALGPNRSPQKWGTSFSRDIRGFSKAAPIDHCELNSWVVPVSYEEMISLRLHVGWILKAEMPLKRKLWESKGVSTGPFVEDWSSKGLLFGIEERSLKPWRGSKVPRGLRDFWNKVFWL